MLPSFASNYDAEPPAPNGAQSAPTAINLSHCLLPSSLVIACHDIAQVQPLNASMECNGASLNCRATKTSLLGATDDNAPLHLSSAFCFPGKHIQVDRRTSKEVEVATRQWNTRPKNRPRPIRWRYVYYVLRKS